MKELWKLIGFTPANFTLESDIGDQDSNRAIIDVPIMPVDKFPKTLVRKEPCNEDFDKCDGITVKNIPKNVEEKCIWEFLIDNGLPLEHGIENIRIAMGEKNSSAIIDGLHPSEVRIIYNNLHYPVIEKKFFESPIYCKPLRALTPAKPPILSSANTLKTVDQSQTSSLNENKSCGIIPGLTKSQQKKAAKKAKERLKKEECKQVENIGIQPTPFVQSAELSLAGVDSAYEFNDLDQPAGVSKFFLKSPASCQTRVRSDGNVSKLLQSLVKIFKQEEPKKR